MYSKELLDLYLKCKNFTQYKQAAMQLGFSTAYIAKINNGREEFTDKTGIFLAIECGIDPEEVLLNLAAARAKTEPERNVWISLAKKYSAELQGALGVALLTAAHPTTNDFLTSLLQLLR